MIVEGEWCFQAVAKISSPKGLASNHQWNLFNFAINKSADVRHRKFLVRMRFYPEVDDPVLLTMVGHVTLMHTKSLLIQLNFSPKK